MAIDGDILQGGGIMPPGPARERIGAGLPIVRGRRIERAQTGEYLWEMDPREVKALRVQLAVVGAASCRGSIKDIHKWEWR